MEIIKKVGIECANSTIKAACGNTILHYQNTVSEVIDSNMNKLLTMVNRDEFEYKGKKYHVGLTNVMGSGSKSTKRYISEEFKLAFIFAIAQLVTSQTEETIKCVTGVPVLEIENESIIKDIKNTLIGRYEVKINGINRKFNITNITVVAQPIGTFLYLYSKGVIMDLAKDIVILDIGMGTTDITVVNFSEGVKKCDTIYIAMSNVLQEILDELHMQYPQLKIKQSVKSIYELDEMIRKGNTLEFTQGKVDAKDIIRAKYDKFVKSIYQELFAFDSNFESYKMIVGTGGGTLMMKDSLIKLLDDKRFIVCDNAVLANVYGFKYLAENNY